MEQKLRQKKQIECDISILEINESVVPLEHFIRKKRVIKKRKTTLMIFARRFYHLTAQFKYFINKFLSLVDKHVNSEYLHLLMHLSTKNLAYIQVVNFKGVFPFYCNLFKC